MLDCFQVDSYGHFFRVVRTKVEAESLEPAWNQEFMVDLEGSENLRLLVYQVHTLTFRILIYILLEKVSGFTVPNRDVNLPNSHPGDGRTANLFFTV
jgi:hypothetical protein